MDEVLPAVLSANSQVLRQVLDLLLPLQVAEGPPAATAGRGQAVQVLAAGQLHRLQRHLSGQAPDHDGEVVRRAGSRADVADLVEDEFHKSLLVENALGLLQQLRLVGAAPSLCNEQEVIIVARLGHHVNLSRQVGPGVRFLKHRHGCNLGVSQVTLSVRPVDALGDVRLIFAVSEHAAPSLRHDGCGSGVLARRHYPPCGGARILQELQGHEPVVAGGLGILEDLREQLEVRGPEEVLDVHVCLVREALKDLPLNPQELLTRGQDECRDAVRGQLPVPGVDGRCVVIEELLVHESRRHRKPAAMQAPHG
mmetsp:Transcript_102872/g.286491  ORF Transcript_102872/g.286491 Transcript_102872/m.286491 type:complete len:310 (+) Transcript_102872:1174-2103(+)